jgi:predicted nucleic acid-binding protein
MPGANSTIRSVLDASIAVRWIVPETGSEAAQDLIEQVIGWIAPRLLVTEVGSALRRKVTAALLDVDSAVQAFELFGQIVKGGGVRFAEDESFVIDALRISLALGHKLPDCLYVALAEREGAPLATANRAVAQLAQKRNVNVFFVPSV